MKKKKIVLIAIVVFLMVSLLTYLNYDKLFQYFSNREWEIADSVGKIEIDNYVEAIGTANDFFLVSPNTIEGYTENGKPSFQTSHDWKEVVFDTKGDYCIIGEKNGTDIHVYAKNEEIWKNTINNASVLGVTINKNGYSAVIYSQTGYKSLVRVYSSTGEELFTSYLASTYALDATIANDNKTLAIAEIDANGVSVISDVKLIDVQEATENNVKKLNLENNELICQVEYDENNRLIAMTDKGIKVLKNYNFVECLNFEEQHILRATIANSKNIFAIQTEEDGVFRTKCYVCSYDVDHPDAVKKYEIEDVPNEMETMGDIVAVECGNKVIFVNSSGHFVKKCEFNGQLKSLKLFHNGNAAVLLFRNKAEFIKVGGF